MSSSTPKTTVGSVAASGHGSTHSGKGISTNPHCPLCGPAKG